VVSHSLTRFVFTQFFSLKTIDYRLLNAMGIDSYYFPTGNDTRLKINAVWNQLTNDSLGSLEVVDVAQGREIHVSKAAKGVAEFTFKELCDEAKGSSDY
jgi:cell division protein ZapE